MTDPDTKQFIVRLTLLAEVLGEPMTPTRLMGYLSSVDDLPIEDLADALNDCARTCRFFPKPVDIRDRVAAIQDTRVMKTIRAWEEANEPRVVAALPVAASRVEPVLTPEERAAREARLEVGWQTLFANAKTLAAHRAMPSGDHETATVAQIHEWRRRG
jgi:hypothetical protein